jgi:Beta-lactamase
MDFKHLHIWLEKNNSDALLILQHGEVLYQYGDNQHRFQCHSMRKSFLSALIGQAVAEEKIDLSLTLSQLEIDDLDPLSATEKQATLYDLLTARSGIYHPANYETPWMRRVKPPRHRYAPGVNWCYSNWDFNALGRFGSHLPAKISTRLFTAASRSLSAWKILIAIETAGWSRANFPAIRLIPSDFPTGIWRASVSFFCSRGAGKNNRSCPPTGCKPAPPPSPMPAIAAPMAICGG